MIQKKKISCDSDNKRFVDEVRNNFGPRTNYVARHETVREQPCRTSHSMGSAIVRNPIARHRELGRNGPGSAYKKQTRWLVCLRVCQIKESRWKKQGASAEMDEARTGANLCATSLRGLDARLDTFRDRRTTSCFRGQYLRIFDGPFSATAPRFDGSPCRCLYIQPWRAKQNSKRVKRRVNENPFIESIRASLAALTNIT